MQQWQNHKTNWESATLSGGARRTDIQQDEGGRAGKKKHMEERKTKGRSIIGNKTGNAILFKKE